MSETSSSPRLLRRFVDRVQVYDGWVAGSERVVIVVASLAMVILVAAPMVIRKLAEHGVPFTNHDGTWVREQVGDYAWMKQAARSLLTWVCFLGASLATRARRHIMIDAVTKPLPLRLRAAFNVVAAFVAGLFCAVLAVVAVYYVRENWTQASHLHGWSKGMLHLVFPIAFATMAARFFVVALADLDGVFSGDMEYLKRFDGGDLPDAIASQASGADAAGTAAVVEPADAAEPAGAAEPADAADPESPPPPSDPDEETTA